MAGFVKLTDICDDAIWVRADAIIMVEPRNTERGIQGATITLRDGEKVSVQESVETVVGRIEGTRNVKACYDEDDPICYAVGYEQLKEREGKDKDVHTAWISVKDRLPEVVDSYIIAGKQRYPGEPWEYFTDVAESHGSYIDDFWDTFNDWVEGQETHVTHWMPLPEAPKEGE